MKQYQTFALIAFPGSLSLNLLALYVFHRHSAIFFSDEWWSAWFPNYLIWAVLAVTSIASGHGAKPKQS